MEQSTQRVHQQYDNVIKIKLTRAPAVLVAVASRPRPGAIARKRQYWARGRSPLTMISRHTPQCNPERGPGPSGSREQFNAVGVVVVSAYKYHSFLPLQLLHLLVILLFISSSIPLALTSLASRSIAHLNEGYVYTPCTSSYREYPTSL